MSFKSSNQSSDCIDGFNFFNDLSFIFPVVLNARLKYALTKLVHHFDGNILEIHSRQRVNASRKRLVLTTLRSDGIPFLITDSCNDDITPHISTREVDMEWLLSCIRARRCLPCDRYTASNSEDLELTPEQSQLHQTIKSAILEGSYGRILKEQSPIIGLSFNSSDVIREMKGSIITSTFNSSAVQILSKQCGALYLDDIIFTITSHLIVDDSVQATNFKDHPYYKATISWNNQCKECEKVSIVSLNWLHDCASASMYLGVERYLLHPEIVNRKSIKFLLSGGSVEQELTATSIINRFSGIVSEEYTDTCDILLVWSPVKRTEKFLLMSAATGKWILRAEEFLNACQRGTKLPSESEMKGFECGQQFDSSDSSDAHFYQLINISPVSCRRNRLRTEGIFIHLNFLLLGDLQPPTSIIKRIIESCGGRVLPIAGDESTVHESSWLESSSFMSMIQKDVYIVTLAASLNNESFRDIIKFVLKKSSSLKCILPAYILDSLTGGDSLDLSKYTIDLEGGVISGKKPTSKSVKKTRVR